MNQLPMATQTDDRRQLDREFKHAVARAAKRPHGGDMPGFRGSVSPGRFPMIEIDNGEKLSAGVLREIRSLGGRPIGVRVKDDRSVVHIERFQG